ncbi:MAG: hypothetical protein JWQ35_1547 [Bacteriovoracaceae bacterium]|nr:hypothetical protein [Bacteriovoracaceae bacterium]
MSTPQFEVVTTTTGAISIRDNLFNEIMHNPVGPWVEANMLYIEQSSLEQKILDESLDELVIFDVGLGAAANTLSALHCIRRHQNKISKKIRIVSFEKNLDLLKFALLNAHRFDYFKGYEKAIETILEKDIWSEANLIWELRRGDFIDSITRETERPHIIFFDPYSPKVNQEMWTMNCFQKIYNQSRASGTSLYTYSQATPIRAALLASGFYVGHGRSTGLKNETTQATTRIEDLESPLAERWLKRWKSSDTPLPFDCTPIDETEIRNKILTHPQFNREK